MPAQKALAAVTRAALTALITLAATGRADACSCKVPGPPCEAAWQTSVVFVGRVLDITTIERPARLEGVNELTISEHRVRVRVVESFRSAVTNEADVITASGGASCGYEFAVGQTYLIYASDDSTGRLSTSHCSRTRPLGEASEDLAYLRSIGPQPGALGIIQGVVKRWNESSNAGEVLPDTPLGGATVVLESNGRRYEARTEKDGTYRMQVPAGRYRVDAQVPDGWYLPSSPMGRFVELLDARGCAGADVIVRADGRISGRVVNARGDSVAGIMVEAVVFSSPDWPDQKGTVFTNERGDYELSRLPPGRYVIGVGQTMRGRGRSQGGLLLHPGVTDLAAATRVDLGNSERLAVADVILPDSARTAPITGVVRDSSGRPVSGVEIWLYGEGTTIAAGPALTDRAGSFHVTMPVGRYRISAELRDGMRFRKNETPQFEASPVLPSFEVTLPD
jgi:hypothetical protein